MTKTIVFTLQEQDITAKKKPAEAGLCTRSMELLRLHNLCK